MRCRTIVACVLLASPSSALGCFEHPVEQTGWLHEAPSAQRYFIGESAEEATTVGVSLAGAGVASLALVVVTFRGLSRARRGRVGPIDFEPAIPAEPPPSFERPVDARIRIDRSHEQPEPMVAGQNEGASSRILGKS